MIPETDHIAVALPAAEANAVRVSSDQRIAACLAEVTRKREAARRAKDHESGVRAKRQRLDADLAADQVVCDRLAADLATRDNPADEKHFQTLRNRMAAKREDRGGLDDVLRRAGELTARAEEALADAERDLEAAEIQAESAALADALKAEVPYHCAALAALAARAEANTIRVDRFNTNLPPGGASLRGGEEMVRDRPRREAAELSRERVELWVREGSTEPLVGGREAQLRVQSRQGDGRGTLVVHDQAVACELWAFWKVTVLPAAPWLKGPRLADLFLPGLRPSEPAFLAPERHYQHFGEAAGGSDALPRPKVEYLPIGRVAVSRG